MTTPTGHATFATKLRLRWQLLLRAVMHLWVKARAMPDPDGNMGTSKDKAVCYVMDDYALSSVLILDRVCEQYGLARPLYPIKGLEDKEHRAYAVLRRLKGLLIQRPSTRSASELLRQLVDLGHAQPDLEIELVPVTVFVGRSPDKSTGFAKILMAENWAVGGRSRRLFSTLINGRDTLVQFSRPISLRELLAEELGPSRSLRKVSRILRMHFRRVRTAVIGPDLSHRRMLIDRIVRTPAVRHEIAEKVRREGITPEKAERMARGYALEIAADFSYKFIRLAAQAIAWFTGKIYRNVEMFNFEQLKESSLDHEIIYVPCHRSHVDYLLLSYLLYQNGFVPPHVAAGINLNLPLIGPFLRFGGAFYLRRTFRAQKLYSAVFNEYMSAIIAQGVSIEYFVEGTRSRTGRLLQPKAGMLAMTVKGYLHAPVRPVMFQPVYIGYEQMLEGASYTRELSGRAKKREKVTDLFKVFGVLGNDYGETSVSFGQPIFLDKLLQEHDPDWRSSSATGQAKPPWMSPLIETLGQQIMRGINAAAHVNPVNLLATVMLATPRQAVAERDLLEQLRLYIGFLQNGPFARMITVTRKQPDEIVSYCVELEVIERTPQALGTLITLNDKKAVELTYFRNNVSHLFALPALIACCFLNQREISVAQLRRIASAIYPFLKSELFLPWSADDMLEALDQNIELLLEAGLLSRSEDNKCLARASGDTDKAGQLQLLAHSLLQTLERYFIAISVLAKNGSGTLSRSELETMCIHTAQRISRLYGFDAPEFHDSTLFRQFIAELRNQNILNNDDSGNLLFGDNLDAVSEHARFILRKEIRQVIMRIAPQADSAPDDPAVEETLETGATENTES